METIEAIKTRRSIRQFTNEIVSDEQLKELMRITAYAPSWRNSQTSRYVAVKDEKIKQQIVDECLKDFDWNKNIVSKANVLFVQVFDANDPKLADKTENWMCFDAGISAQTLCLAAHDMGLGTVILGIYDNDKLKDVLKLKENEQVSCLIALGYHNQNPNTPPRKGVEELLKIL